MERLKMQVTQLVILAGGKGARLLKETKILPKPLVTLFDKKAILDILLDRFIGTFDNILILAGYKGELIQDHISHSYSDVSSNIKVVMEDDLAGTGGALLVNREFFNDYFMLINGDTWFDTDLQGQSFIYPESCAQLLLTNSPDSSRYGAVEIDKAGRIVSFIEKTRIKEQEEGLINTGCYLVSKTILGYIKTLPCSLEQDIFPLLSELRLLEGRIENGAFLDIGIPSALEFARQHKEFFTS
jgi:D-glycero-D-manno-heptose 1,7-bisphosphate phosphatase